MIHGRSPAGFRMIVGGNPDMERIDFLGGLEMLLMALGRPGS
jgi:hypothetical protein